MRIGIDARMYGPRQGGIGRYIQQLILNLEKLDSANNSTVEFVIFLRQENWAEYEPKRANFSKILADVPWYGWREQILLPRIIKKAKIDLMHFPHWNVPLFYNRPFIVTIHDLILLHHPTRAASTLGPVAYFLKQLFYKKTLRHAANAAKEILTVSEFSRQDIYKTLNIPLEKITVAYPAPLPIESEAKITKAPFANSLPPQKYLLYVGVAYPHKNLENLLRAWKIFNDEGNTGYKLALAGKDNFFYQRLQRLAAELNLHNVIFLDFIPDSYLPSLYRNAAAFVFPSVYEGFGIPPLEAMQYQIPVISSDFTCLPEILKDGALYFDPQNPEDIARAINLVFTDENLRQKLVAAGQKIYPQFSWRNLAQKTWEIYQKSV